MLRFEELDPSTNAVDLLCTGSAPVSLSRIPSSRVRISVVFAWNSSSDSVEPIETGVEGPVAWESWAGRLPGQPRAIA